MINELNKWLETLKGSTLPNYDDLPDVSLYMEQIVSYIDNILQPYSRDEQKMITSFMVNNYVKAKIIDAPTYKRYDKNQVSYLIAVCLLKQITSMSNLAVLLDKDNFNSTNGEMYDSLVSIHANLKDSIINKTLNNLERIEKGDKPTRGKRKKEITEEVVDEDVLRKNLLDYALRLIVEAEINKMISERILYIIGNRSYHNNPMLFKEASKEEKHANKAAKSESKRIKKVISSKI